MNERHLERPNPYWHWKAAGNFICGGAGSGLVFFASLLAPAAAARVLVFAGLVLVALGLFFVWLEIGRPWRAPNVLLHLRTSWMSREALAANVLFLCGLGVLLGLQWATWPTAVAALVFLYCQARLIGASRGIPTWHHPLTFWLLIVTGLAEGLGLFWLLGSWSQPTQLLSIPLAVLVLARWGLWREWRKQLAGHAARPALRALAREEPTLVWFGTVAPIAFLLIAIPAATGTALDAWLLAAAGLAAAATGASFKFILVTRTAWYHGYSVPRMPVRGAPRTAPL
jgi:phenylacetyl-CoA:acceptor oxidoreductase 26-kDa subunit